MSPVRKMTKSRCDTVAKVPTISDQFIFDIIWREIERFRVVMFSSDFSRKSVRVNEACAVQPFSPNKSMFTSRMIKIDRLREKKFIILSVLRVLQKGSRGRRKCLFSTSDDSG